MNGRHAVLLAAASAFLAASAAGQDRAVPRSGGRGGSRGVSSRPAPTSGSSGVSSSRGRSSSSPPSAHRAPSRGLTPAERRHPRAGTGTGARHGGYYPGRPGYPWYPGGGWGGYYRPYYRPYYWDYWWPYSYYGYYGGWGGGYAPLGTGVVYTYAESDRGAVRVLVDPTEARVYVDGYYAGVVDDFDGLFQRLHLSPGRHEVRLKLSGFKTHTVRVYVTPGTTLKIDHEMEEGFGETYEDLSGGTGAPVREARGSWSPPEAQESSRDESQGELRLQVSPSDASVYVDGRFRGTGRETETLSLAPGSHRIEVVRPGYRTENRDVEVGAREPAEVRIDLERP